MAGDTPDPGSINADVQQALKGTKGATEQGVRWGPVIAGAVIGGILIGAAVVFTGPVGGAATAEILGGVGVGAVGGGAAGYGVGKPSVETSKSRVVNSETTTEGGGVGQKQNP